MPIIRLHILLTQGSQHGINEEAEGHEAYLHCRPPTGDIERSLQVVGNIQRFTIVETIYHGGTRIGGAC